MTQKSLMWKALLYLACHPVVGEDHALSHSLMDLQRLFGHKGCNVLIFIQLSPNLHPLLNYVVCIFCCFTSVVLFTYVILTSNNLETLYNYNDMF